VNLPRVLVVEDGHEYIDNLRQFLGAHFDFVRAGDGPEALALISSGGTSAIFLDMKFDRSERLLGDREALVQRFAGDTTRARSFLENNQGTYIMAALREAGCTLPAVFSYDFDSEPRRFQNLLRRYGPLLYLNDAAGPADIRAALEQAVGSP